MPLMQHARQQHPWQVVRGLKQRQGNPRYLVVSRKWDETAMHLGLTRRCAEHVLMWSLKRLETEECLTPEERARAAQNLSKQCRATVSVMTQGASVAWDSADGKGQGEILILAPAVLQRNSSSCMISALDAAVQCLSKSSLVSLSPFIDVIFICLVSDSCAANLRLCRSLACDTPRNIIVYHQPCVVHLCALVARECLNDSGMVSPLFCLANLLRFSTYRSKLIQAIAARVHKVLRVVVVAELPAAAEEWRARATAVLAETCLRQQNTRAAAHPLHKAGARLQQTSQRLPGQAEQAATGPAEGGAKPRRPRRTRQQRLSEWTSELLRLDNSDWREPEHIIHYCVPGCCPDDSPEARQKHTASRILKVVNNILNATMPKAGWRELCWASCCVEAFGQGNALRHSCASAPCVVVSHAHMLVCAGDGCHTDRSPNAHLIPGACPEQMGVL